MNVRLSEFACGNMTCRECLDSGFIGPGVQVDPKTGKKIIPANKELIWNARFGYITTTDISCGMRLIQGISEPIKMKLFQTTFFSKYQDILGPKPPLRIEGISLVLERHRHTYLNFNHQYVMSSTKCVLEAFEKAVKDLELGVTFRTPYIHNYNYNARDITQPLNLEGTPAFKDNGHAIAVLTWMWNGLTCDPAKAGVKDWYWNWKDGTEL